MSDRGDNGSLRGSPNAEQVDAFIASFDHTDPLWNEHIHDLGAEIRGRCPVLHSEAHGGYWVLTRYEDILRASRDAGTYTVEKGIMIVDDFDKRPLIRPGEMDGPIHREYRRVLNPPLTMSALQPLVSSFRASAHE